MGAAVKIAAGAALTVAGAVIPGAQSLIIPGLKMAAGTLAISLGASLALGGIAQAIQKPPSGIQSPQGAVQTFRQAAAPRRVLYGLRRVGGILTFANFWGLVEARLQVFGGLGERGEPADQNQLVITIAGHAIDSIQDVHFDDERPEIDLTTGIGLGPWYGKVFLEWNYGYDGQEAFPSLVTDSQGIWTADHRQRGCARVYARLNYNEELYPNGVPNISFTVKGKLVFDPRTDSPITVIGATNATPIVIEATGHGFVGGEVVRIVGVNSDNMQQPNGTWGIDFVDANHFSLQGSNGTQAYVSGGQIFKLGYSPNWALCTADYILDPWVGMGVPWAKIREAVLIASANISDEEIELDEASPPTTERRYTLNATFETSEQHGEILAKMANAGAGHVTYIGGEWHIIAGAFRLPVMELTDSDVVAQMKVDLWRPKRDLVNGVKGTFPSALHNYIETDFPAIPGATYLAEDRGIRVWKDIFLPFTTSPTACQRIAEIDLNRNRRQISVQMTCSMRAYELQPGDVVEFTHSHYSWALETFEVAECGLGRNDDGAMTVTLQLVQTDVNVYGFAVDDYGNLIDPDLLDLLSRTVPFGWSPGMVHRPDSTVDALRARADYSFGITQQYRLTADGSITPQLNIAGFLPTNLFSTAISRPRTKTLTATTASTGGFLKGGERYYIAVAALDQVVSGSPPVEDLGRLTALSEIAFVDVLETSPPTDTNTVTIHGLRWHPNTAGWYLYFGTDKFRLSNQPGALYAPTLGSAVTVTGPEHQPTSITFKGLNVPLQLPDGYFEHLRGAPDHRFDHLKIKAARGIHFGIWGGQVVSVSGVGSPATEPYTITLGVDPADTFTVNALAGRFIMVVGILNQDLELTTNSGMPLAEFLIASNTGTTVTLATGQANPASNGFVPLAVVVICTKATSVGEDAIGHFIEDTGFGEGGQTLGSATYLGGGDDSLRGNIIRGISGAGVGEFRVITGNAVATKKIYVGDDNPFDVDSVFIVTDPHPAMEYLSKDLQSEKNDAFVSFRIDAAANLAGEQYIIQAFSVSKQGKVPTFESSSPYRLVYLFGRADAGREVTTDTKLTVLDRFVRGNTTAGPFTITALPPSAFPGIEVLIENSGTGGKLLTVITADASLLGGAAALFLEDTDAVLIRARSDP